MGDKLWRVIGSSASCFKSIGRSNNILRQVHYSSLFQNGVNSPAQRILRTTYSWCEIKSCGVRTYSTGTATTGGCNVATDCSPCLPSARSSPLCVEKPEVTKSPLAPSVKAAMFARKPEEQRSRMPLDFDKNFENRLFDILLEPCEETVSLKKYLCKLKEAGLREDDPRLAGLFARCQSLMVRDLTGKDKHKDQNVPLDRETFTACVKESLMLVKKALTGEFVIPDFKEFTSSLDHMYWNCKANANGVIPSKIPQLARYGPDSWGVSLCTIDGQRYSQGNSTTAFSMQSLSKPFAYALAVKDLGAETVHQYVGLEHFGDAYEQILVDRKGQPHNPMVDSGGIVVSSLIKSNLRSADRFEYVFNEFKKMAGNEYLMFNNSVYLSEREAADREFALSYYMKEKQCFPEGVTIQETLDLYAQMNSIDTNCDTGSVLAATLANGGICPLTGERLLDGNTIRYALSLMHSCGMNNYSGHFAFYVGLPCKSSMSGALLIVIPNVGGICTWSPPLDLFNNSVRGIQFSRDLVNEFNFHNYDNQLTKNKLDPRRRRSERDIREKVITLFAAQNGDLNSLNNLSLAGHDMAVTDYDGRTPLHLAAAEGHLDCVRYLVDKCAVPIFNKDRSGRTPLEEATRFDHKLTIEYLQSKQPCS